MMREPFKYQKQALAWASDRNAVAFSLEKRLGKSLVAIRWSQEQRCCRVLVVAPLSVLGEWQNELRSEGFGQASVGRGAKAFPDFSRSPFFLTNYESLRISHGLQRGQYDCVMLDESRTISNPKAEITKVCLDSFKRVPFKACLSGCPAPESVLEHFCQHKFLRGSFCGFKNFYEFRAEMFISDPNGWRFDVRPGCLPQILAEVDRHSFILSRKGAGLYNVNIEQKYSVELDKASQKVYDTTESDFELFGKETKWKPAVMTWLHRLAGGCHPQMETDHKIKELWPLLLTDFKKEPVCVWCKYTSEIDRLMRSGVMKASRRAAFIDGRVPAKERFRIIRDFQGGKLDTLVAQVGCLKYGVNLSRSSTNIFYSLPQDLNSWLQAKDRIMHPTKKEPCLTISLNTKNTVDEDIVQALLTKKNEVTAFQSLVLQNMRRRHAN